MKNNIVLIGMPAVGKSTIGVLLAKRLGLTFVDTDLLIQHGEGCLLQELIGRLGTDGFCDLEAAYVCKLSAEQSVIATGGSVVYRAETMDHLKCLGTIIWLTIDLAGLTSRLEKLDERGVVRLPGQSIEQLYEERIPLYRKYAQISVDTSRKTTDQVVQSVLKKLGK